MRQRFIAPTVSTHDNMERRIPRMENGMVHMKVKPWHSLRLEIPGALM